MNEITDLQTKEKFEMLKITVITADGSEWLLDDKFVEELERDFANDDDARNGFTAWVEDFAYDNAIDDWLFQNAKLSKPSGLLSCILDGVNPDDDEPYANGYKKPSVKVEGLERG